MIVVACVKSVRNTKAEHTIPNDFLKGDTVERGILTLAENFAHKASATRILLLDNKHKDSLPAENEVSPQFREVFNYQAVFFEAALQEAGSRSDTKQVGDYCLVRTDGKGGCSCGGILHEFLRQLAIAFPEEHEINLIICPACYSRVADYLEEWVATPEVRPAQNHSTISIYGYGRSQDWRSFSALASPSGA